MQKKYQRFSGFTLMELLIVMAILAMLFALLLPRIFEQRRNQVSARADIEIQTLYGDLELYATTSRHGYPTTEEGLYALAYIPDRVGVSASPLTAAIPGAEGMTGYDPTGGSMIGAGGGFGTTPNQPVGQPNPMGQNNLVGTNSMNPANGMIASGTNPSQMMNPMTTSASLGQQGAVASYSAWTQPIHNPLLYQQRRLRPDGIDEKKLIDPWGSPYRYDNTLNQFGVNQHTWKATPAIWSAGPDKRDGNDDDVRGWEMEDIPDLQARVTEQFQQQAGGMTGMGSALGTGVNDPSMGMAQPNMMPPMTGGTQPNMMSPMTGGTQPNMMSPMTGGTQPNMMPPMGGMTQPNMMPPMGGMTQPNMMSPMTGGTQPNMMSPMTGGTP